MKLALLHDDFYQWGGAERLVQALADNYPDAPIFTLGYNPALVPVNLQERLIASPLQKFTGVNKFYRAYSPLMPSFIENFDFSTYDVLLSSSARFAHGAITKPDTLHISYINSPGRMWWEGHDYFPKGGAILQPVLSLLRLWDKVASNRPDVVIANSKYVQKKIAKYWGRESKVVYPFVDDPAQVDSNHAERGDPEPLGVQGESHDSSYFLVVTRLLAWKRVDLVIRACNNLKLPLVIIGDGPDRKKLQDMAGRTVKLVGSLTEIQKHHYYEGCQALIQMQIEDFGLTPLEAMSHGKPVIAYGLGGARETVSLNTGVFLSEQTVEGLMKILENFDKEQFDPQESIRQAHRFNRETFIKEISEIIGNNV